MKNKNAESTVKKKDDCSCLEILGGMAIAAFCIVLVCVAVDAIGNSINENIDKRFERSVEQSGLRANQLELNGLSSKVSVIDHYQDFQRDRLTRLIKTQPKEIQKKVDGDTDAVTFQWSSYTCCSQ